MVRRTLFTLTAALAMFALTAGAAHAQTVIKLPKNKSTPKQDVDLGRERAPVLAAGLRLVDGLGRVQQEIEEELLQRPSIPVHLDGLHVQFQRLEGRHALHK